MDNENLRDLIFRIRDNDRQALSLLYQEMKTSVYSLALVYTKSDFDAEDIMQNTFIKIWSSAESFRGTNARSWILTITRNLALDWFRASRRGSELSESIPADDCFEKINANDTVRELFSYLNEGEREIVLLRSYGFSFDEIAAVVKSSVSGVKGRYYPALKKIRKIYGGDKDE